MKLLSCNIHFAVGKDERLDMDRIADSLPGEGGACCGPDRIRHEDWSRGEAAPPLPAALPGDFNAAPGSPGYLRITEGEGLTDAWTDQGAQGSDHQPVWTALRV